MSISDIIQVILAILTFIGVGVALATTAWSIHAQNKQSLFEKRLEVYLLCKTIYGLIKENQKIFDIRSQHGYPINIDFEFSWITNTDFFNGSPKIIFDIYNEEYRYKFLQKLEELGILSEKCILLFKKENGERLSSFISSYCDVLRSMYSYQIVLNKMRNDPTNEIIKANSKYGNSSMMPKDAKQLGQEYGEPKHRKKVLDDISELKRSFIALKDTNILEKIKKQLIL